MAHVPGRIFNATPLRIPAGGTARLAVSLPTAPQMGKVEYELSDPPDGIAIQGVATDRGDPEITLQADASKVHPGLEGNLILQAYAEHSPESNSDDPNAKKRRVPLGALPAVPFEIIAR